MIDVLLWGSLIGLATVPWVWIARIIRDERVAIKRHEIQQDV